MIEMKTVKKIKEVNMNDYFNSAFQFIDFSRVKSLCNKQFLKNLSILNMLNY